MVDGMDVMVVQLSLITVLLILLSVWVTLRSQQSRPLLSKKSILAGGCCCLVLVPLLQVSTFLYNVVCAGLVCVCCQFVGLCSVTVCSSSLGDEGTVWRRERGLLCLFWLPGAGSSQSLLLLLTHSGMDWGSDAARLLGNSSQLASKIQNLLRIFNQLESVIFIRGQTFKVFTEHLTFLFFVSY